jgi:dTDP-4-dehydrorhamnose reductase
MSQHILLRLTTLIGIHQNFQRHNPVSFLIPKIIKHENLMLVNDVITNFLYVDDLAKILTKILLNNVSGEYNIAGDESLSRFELGLKVKSFFPSSCSIIQSCNSFEFQTTAPRPKNVVLQNEKIKKTLGFEFAPIDSALHDIIYSDTYKSHPTKG